MSKAPRRQATVAGITAIAAITAVAVFLTTNSPAATTTSRASAARVIDDRLESVTGWAPAIGSGGLRGDLAARYADFDLVVVDGQEAKPSQIAAIQSNGSLVLGYLSVGTIESYRPWYDAAKRYRLESWKDWQGEWFARVSAPGFRHLISRQIAPGMLDKGFDGLFLDNTDMIYDHRGQTAGMRRLIATLGEMRERRGTLLFAQNGAETIGPSLRYLDGWNREDVSWTYDFNHHEYRRQGDGARRAAQDELTEIAARGLLVSAIDYTAPGDDAADAESIANACAVGALPFASNISLRRIPASAYRCEG